MAARAYEYTAAVDRVAAAVDDINDALSDLEGLNPGPGKQVALRYLDARSETESSVPVAHAAATIEEATDLLVRFYERARGLGWATPEMADARQYLRRVAPQEVW